MNKKHYTIIGTSLLAAALLEEVIAFDGGSNFFAVAKQRNVEFAQLLYGGDDVNCFSAI